jgi:SAM-dependent methyltransferase
MEPCEICGCSTFAQHRAREMMFGTRDAFTYSECLECGRLKLIDPPSDLARYYPSAYYSFARDRKLDRLKNFGRSAISRVWLGPIARQFLPRQTSAIVSTIGATSGMRILDVGGGNGKLVRELRSAGFKNALAIDPFISTETTDAIRASIHTVQGEWDRILFNHSFEHLADHAETLRAVSSMLAPGGLCLIRVPVASSWAWKEYGVDWVQLDCPRHLMIPTVKSMELLAAAASMKVDHVVFDSTPLQFWGSEAYRRNISLVDIQTDMEAHFPQPKMAEFEKRADEFNQQRIGDQAAFILRSMPYC